MKTVQEKLHVEKSGELEITPFQQRHNAESFELLSSGIYKYPVLAIIRELSANAVDAHVVGRNVKTPYIIHTPTTLEPYWRIRDFGTGIAPDKIKTIYTVYFESDKRDNNDTTGEKGLGSKTPFAYTDNFQVASFYKGKKYCYTAFRNDDGLPCIANAPDFGVATSEHDGLEVKFSVKREDHHQFQAYLAQALRFFKFKPVVENQKNFQFLALPKYLIETPEFAIPDNSNDSSYLIMGNIGYPIEIEAFEKTAQRLDAREAKLINYGIHLNVPIGSPVKTQASREALNYTPNCRVYIKKILAKAVEVVEEEANKKLKDAKTIWDARVLFGHIRTGVIGEICDLENTNYINWKGHKISDVITLTDFPKADHPQKIEQLSTLTATEEYGYKRRRRKWDNSGAVITNAGNGLRRWDITAFPAEETELIFVNDIDRGGYAAATRYMQEHKIKKAIMFSDAPKKFIDAVGCGHLLIYVSTLPKPERQPRTYNSGYGRDRTLIQRVDGNYLRNCEVNVKNGGVYVEVRRDKVKWWDTFKSDNFRFHQLKDGVYANGYTYSVLDHIANLKMFGYGVDEPIYAIRPCDMARIERYKDKWVPLRQCMANVLTQWSGLLSEARLAKTAETVNTTALRFADCKFDNHSVAKATIELLQACQAAAGNPLIEAFEALNNYVGMYEIKPVEEVIKQVKLFDNTYKLIQHTTISASSRPEIENYIRMVDRELAIKKPNKKAVA